MLVRPDGGGIMFAEHSGLGLDKMLQAKASNLKKMRQGCLEQDKSAKRQVQNAMNSFLIFILSFEFCIRQTVVVFVFTALAEFSQPIVPQHKSPPCDSAGLDVASDVFGDLAWQPSCRIRNCGFLI